MPNDQQPKIEYLKETYLTGQKLKLSFADNRTVELWRRFAPRIKEIPNRKGNHLFSVDIYPNPAFFQSFDPHLEFEKWAAVEVTTFENIPEGMETLILPQGQYAVFHYQGKPSEAAPVFQYIYGIWLPASPYQMDERPYFALMGEKYKGEDPDSEEEFWIPVKS